MKSPGIIYRRYRQIKKKLLYEKIVAAKLRVNENCHYGRTAIVEDGNGVPRRIKVCLFSIDGTQKMEICSNPLECNAYVSKWTKEKVIEEFNKEINDWGTKNKLYPQLTFFEWILDRDLTEAMKEPGWVSKVIIIIIDFLEGILKVTNNKKKKYEETKDLL